MKLCFVGSIALTLLAQLGLAFDNDHWLNLCLLMFLYFVAFNFLEASLPSLISKQASAKNKGTAMGVYSSSQFLGIFAGGSLSGLLYEWHQCEAIFIANATISLLWLMIALSMRVNSDSR